MIDYNWKKTLSGERTQIRLPVKPNHHALNVWRTELGSELRIGELGDSNRIGVVQTSGRDMYLVGKTYAVQPGRGQKSVAHIRILRIRREDVREISAADANAEGYATWMLFLDTWLSMHDKSMVNKWEHWIKRLENRPAKRYEAWVLTFEVVK